MNTPSLLSHLSIILCLSFCPAIFSEDKGGESPGSVAEPEAQLAAEKAKNEQLTKTIAVMKQVQSHHDKQMKDMREELKRIKESWPLATKKSEKADESFGTLTVVRKGRKANVKIQQEDLTADALKRIETEVKEAIEEANKLIAKNIAEAKEIQESIKDKIEQIRKETDPNIVQDLFKETWQPLMQARSKVIEAAQLSGDPEHTKLMGELTQTMFILKKNTRKIGPRQKERKQPEDKAAEDIDF